jgi:signal transduction histidine kinase
MRRHIFHDKSFRASFSSKLFLIFTLFTGLIAVAFVAVLISAEIRNYRERSSEKVQQLASLLAGSIRLPLYAENIAELTHHASGLLETPHVARVVITNSNNRKLVDLTSPFLSSYTTVITSRTVVSSVTASPSAESALSGVTPLPSSQLGMVSVSIDTGDMTDSIRSAIIKSCCVALLFWLAVVLASYPVLRRLTRTFNALTDGLCNMMDGNFSGKIVMESDDEAGRAALAVNCLAEAMLERESKNHRLQFELIEAMNLKFEEEKKQNMAKLIQTNRMTSLGLLVSSMAHEINNPNGAIRLDGNFLGKMLHNMDPVFERMTCEDADFRISGLCCEEARQELFRATESIIHNTNRIETVIKDLRAYSLGADTPFTPGINVNRVVSGALTIIRAHGHYTHAVIKEELSPAVPDITGSHHQLEQVVVNLLLNALQSLQPEGGTVTVSTCYNPALYENVVTVRDTGEGIPHEHLERLFEPFFSTRIESGGSGLGLYISGFIVSEHGGCLEFDSQVDVGTTARVRLPVCPTMPVGQV